MLSAVGVAWVRGPLAPVGDTGISSVTTLVFGIELGRRA